MTPIVAMPAALCRLIEAWPKLPRHIQSAMTTLLDASGIKPVEAPNDSIANRNEAARRAASDCRYVIQGCLREEEWRDAEEEFYEVILEAFSG